MELNSIGVINLIICENTVDCPMPETHLDCFFVAKNSYYSVFSGAYIFTLGSELDASEFNLVKTNSNFVES